MATLLQVAILLGKRYKVNGVRKEFNCLLPFAFYFIPFLSESFALIAGPG